MAMICASIDRRKVAQADDLCARAGRPYRFQKLIDSIDFDPDDVLAHVDHLLAAHDAAVEAAASLDSVRSTDSVWAGDGADDMRKSAECQRGFWEQVADFLLWLAENLLQLLDYVVDLLRIVVAWITFVVGAIATIVTVVVLVVVLVATGGLGAAIDAVAAIGWLGIMGIIAAVGAVLSLILWALNKLFEWLETVVRDARASICGKGLPSLPDWDPTGWEPPGWPV